jgi:hypothetical protein
MASRPLDFHQPVKYTDANRAPMIFINLETNYLLLRLGAVLGSLPLLLKWCLLAQVFPFVP